MDSCVGFTVIRNRERLIHVLDIAGRSLERMDLDKGSEWILSVARHRDPIADPVGMMINAEIDLDS